MQVSPALPWSQGQGGVIHLATPITYDELRAGILKFKSNVGNYFDYQDHEVAQGVHIFEIGYTPFGGSSNNIYYVIESWEGVSDTIEVEHYQGAPSIPYLVDVELAILNSGIYGIQGAVFRVDDNRTVYPLCKYINGSIADWWVIDNGALTGSAFNYPAPTYLKSIIQAALDNYGDASLYNIDNNGEVMPNLTIENVNLIS